MAKCKALTGSTVKGLIAAILSGAISLSRQNDFVRNTIIQLYDIQDYPII